LQNDTQRANRLETWYNKCSWTQLALEYIIYTYKQEELKNKYTNIIINRELPQKEGTGDKLSKNPLQ
jgi:hypothetical protein